MWNRLKALIIKELQIIWLDKKSRYALIIPPLIQIVILSYAATLEVKNISVAIYNQDVGWYSHEVIARIKGSPYFDKVYEVQNLAAVEEAINTQKVIIGLEFQSDFSRRMVAGESTTIQAILDGRKANSSQIVEGYFFQILQDFSKEIVRSQQKETQPSIITNFRAWFNPNLNFIWYTVPGLIAILCTVLVVSMASLSISREHEAGTFDQLLVAPITSWQILLGKSIPAVLIGIGETTLMILIAMAVFHVPFVGSIFLFYISLIVFIISLIGIGLFISSFSKTQQQSVLGAFIFTVPAILISGFVAPVEYIQDWLRWMSYLMPTTYFLVIIKSIFLKDISFVKIVAQIWPMMLISVFTLLIALFAFRRSLD